MSAAIEDQRDLRSAHRDSKRFRDSSTKWLHGARPSAGCRFDWQTLESVGGTESQQAKMRPRGKNSDASHQRKRDQNIIKGRHSWETPQKRVQAVVKARDEIQESTLSQSLLGLGIPSGERMSLSDGFTYSFDRTESPNLPMSLGVYVKPSTERDTERFVQREYEVLDTNGELLRGLKARQDLRKVNPGVGVSGAADEDGFELI